MSFCERVKDLLKGWLVVFGLTILSFYSIYFYQILRGQPDRFEKMLLEGLGPQPGYSESGAASPGLIALVIGVSLLLEAGYFVLSLCVISIPAYQVITFLFVLFEVWHGIKAIPIIRALMHPDEFTADLFDWRLERISAQLYVLHILTTFGLLIFV